MALNTTPTVPVHELHQFLLMGIQGQEKNRKIGALTYKSELAVIVETCSLLVGTCRYISLCLVFSLLSLHTAG